MIGRDNPDFVLCTRCGKRMTKDKSGLCSECRRKAQNRVLCKICGKHMTVDPSDVCATCRREHAAPAMRKMKKARPEIGAEYIDDVIQRTFDELTVLRYYKDGRSFQEIANELGWTRHQVASTLRKLLGARLFDSAHGNVISAVEKAPETDEGEK